MGHGLIRPSKLRSGGFFNLAEPLVVGMGKRQYQADLQTLKDLMEAKAL